jgi:phage repressor protein C with HTH and peptisase S24 domain
LGIISVDADKKPYGINVEGDSMVEAGIPDGADIAINPAEEVREGDSALVCFGQRGDWAVKWVHFHRDGSVELRSSTSQYPAKIFPCEDVENGFLKVIGRVMCVISLPKRSI